MSDILSAWINWVFIATVIIVLFMMIRGARRGFLRIAFSFVSLILLTVLFCAISPKVAEAIKDNTNIEENIESKVEEWLEEKTDSMVPSDEAAAAAGESDGATSFSITGIPNAASNYILGSSGEIMESLGIYEAIAERISGYAVTAMAFVVTLILALIIIFILRRATSFMNKVPVIGGFNRFCGLIAGFVQGLIIVWILLLLVSLMSTSEFGASVIQRIDANPVMSRLYYNNMVVNLICFFLK